MNLNQLFPKNNLLLSKPYITQNILQINSSNLLWNFDFFQRLSENIFPVIKSNGYGHGIKEIAKILDQKDFPYLIVDGFHEVLEVREVTKRPILVMGYVDPENFQNINAKDVSFVVQSPEVINAIGKTKKPTKVHLEINTGMNRWGIDPVEVTKYIELILKYPNITLEGVLSHLANSDSIDDEYTKYQSAIFDICIEKIYKLGIKPKYIHISNSGGSAKNYSRYTNAIRPGIGLYGIKPNDEKDSVFAKIKDLKPVAALYSKIIKVFEVGEGDKIGYNCSYEATKKSKIAVIPIGYYEGLDRRLSNIGKVRLIDKIPTKTPRFSSIVGKVCMNITMIDVTDHDCKVGDVIEVISPNQFFFNSISNQSKLCNDIEYTLLVNLNESIRRKII